MAVVGAKGDRGGGPGGGGDGRRRRFSRAEGMPYEPVSKYESARLPFMQHRLAELTGNAADAVARYRRSNALYPHPDNGAAALRRLGVVP